MNRTGFQNPIRTAGLSKKQLLSRIEPLRTSESSVSVELRSSPNGYDIFVLDRGGGRERQARVFNRIERAVSDIIYGHGGESIVSDIGRRLIGSGKTLAIAESLTGGLLSDRLTDVPGSSSYFMCSVVTYSNGSKIDLLGVSRETLEKWGAVSRKTCAEMLAGLSNIGTFDYRIAVTGIAGPEGGSPKKPVGTVYLGFQSDTVTVLKRLKLVGSRRDIKEETCSHAMSILWKAVAGLPII